MNPTIRFASKLYQKLNNNLNIFYSPYSLFCALGMCQAGAKNEAKNVLCNLLEVPVEEEKQFFKDLIAETNNHNDKYELVTANALWVQENLELNKEYQALISADYAGSINNVNYGDVDGTVSKINNWCNENTHQKIATIIEHKSINHNTLLILTNAIYFKGKWDKAFDKNNTHNKPFITPNGTIDVPTMNQVGPFLYGENENFQSLNMDYQGDDLAMLIVLPKLNVEFNENIEEIFNTALNGLHYQGSVNVSLPKFKMETCYNLEKAFIDLGAGLAFSNSADFSGITNQEPLMISKVVHKAFVECDEEGTEAAAATAVVCVLCCVSYSPIEFNADHSFLFFIYNKINKNILFNGKVVNPS